MSFVEKQQFRGKNLLILDDNPEQLAKATQTMSALGFNVTSWLVNDDPKLLVVKSPIPGIDLENIPANLSWMKDDIIRQRTRIELINKFDAIILDEAMFRAKIAATAVDALLTDYGMLKSFYGLDAIRETKAVKGAIPMVMHSGAYEEQRKSAGHERADHIKKKDTELVQRLGGIAAFDKGDDEAITQAFATAFAQRANQR